MSTNYTAAAADAAQLTLQFAGMQVTDTGVVTLCDDFAGMAVDGGKPAISLPQMQSDIEGAAKAPWGEVQSSLLEQLDTQGDDENQKTLRRFETKVLLPVLEALENGFQTSLYFDADLLKVLYTNTVPFLEWGFNELCNGDLPGSSGRVLSVKSAIGQQLEQRQLNDSGGEMECV